MWLHPVLSAYGHFNPLHPRRRRRLNQLAWGDNQADFNPLHPRRRRRCKSYGAGSATEISIHSTREGGDANGPAYDDYMNQFQSTPPAKAETMQKLWCRKRNRNFNPLHPRRRRRCKSYGAGSATEISIHSTREGGDDAKAMVQEAQPKFQSTPPAKAETIAEPSEKLYSLISIHSTHEGGDDYPVLACN